MSVNYNTKYVGSTFGTEDESVFQLASFTNQKTKRYLFILQVKIKAFDHSNIC